MFRSLLDQFDPLQFLDGGTEGGDRKLGRGVGVGGDGSHANGGGWAKPWD